MRAAWIACVVLLAGCPSQPAPLDAPRTDVPGGTDAPASDAGGSIDLNDAPADAWSFVRIPGAVCGNGSPAGIGVHRHPGATEVVIVVQGGGACWDAESCFTTMSASHVAEDYTDAMFVEERAVITGAGWDDRSNALNPFRAAHLVYVPYCTGDIHGGDAVQTYPGAPAPVHHRGSADFALFLTAMHAAWPELTTVRAIGFSAGGYGLQLQWGTLATTWPDAELSLLADCSPMAEPDAALYATWRASWNMITPSGCTACASSLTAYDEHFDAAFPDVRFGLLATRSDAVVTAFWQVDDFPARFDTLLDTLEDNDTTRFFAVESDHHVILGELGTLVGADGTTLADWVVGGWLENDPARWRNVRP